MRTNKLARCKYRSHSKTEDEIVYSGPTVSGHGMEVQI